MIFQIIEENGTKKIVPLTADAGAGAPVGSLISMYKKSSPSGYLYCDGSTFDANAYPLLYAYLGSNVLPDYREFALVGAEQNTTDTIASHDVYTEGQAKDDQLQEIEGSFTTDAEGIGKVISNATGAFELENSMNVYAPTASSTSFTRHDVKFKASNVARAGTVTRGKRKAVYFYIKATSGLSENAQDNVLATINENLSYSTTEHKTGKKWIDGKPIYSKTIVIDYPTNSIDVTSLRISTIVSINGFFKNNTQWIIPIGFNDGSNNANVYWNLDNTILTIITTATGQRIINIEYTKTTD